jgi:lipid II:glycine glycyltransferase (peptidoglycan interpeptide bridge formation enzyme)
LAFRENMPLSTIIYDVQKTDEVLLDEMHDSCKTKVKKAMKKNILFKTLDTVEEQELFYHDWKEISGKKDF